MAFLKIKNEIPYDLYLKLNSKPEKDQIKIWIKYNNCMDRFEKRRIYKFYIYNEKEKYYAKFMVGNKNP